jgi:hypothetical protein
MRLQRSVGNEFQGILCEGKGRYLELERRPTDKREEGTFGSSAAEPPHSRECSYMNLLRADGGGVGGWRGARRKVCCRRIYVLPLGTRQ